MVFYPTIPARAEGLQLTPTQMREDLVYLKNDWAPLDKSFSDPQRLEFNRLVDKLAADADSLQPQQFALEVMRAAAIPRNGHTSANVGVMLGDDLPLRAWWFADGLYIVKAHPDFARLLGARIDKIGQLTTADAQERVAPYLSGTDQRIRFLSPGYLVTPSVLRQIGAIADTASVPLAVRLVDGTSETVELRASSQGDPGDERAKGLNRGYSVLTPDEPDLPGRWLHVLDKVGERSPLYSKRGDVQSRFLDDAKRVLYIRNDTVNSVDETPLLDKFAGIVHQSILPAQPRYIIVDLRMNNGGDFFNTILFAKAMPRLTPADGHVFVLVGRATFSAAITTAGMLKTEGGGKVTLVGEPMGDGGQFWSEGKRLTLPHSQIAVRYSPLFHDYENGCTDMASCYWAAVAFGPSGISLKPETTIDVTFADYAAGRDPVLKFAMDQLARD